MTDDRWQSGAPPAFDGQAEPFASLSEVCGEENVTPSEPAPSEFIVSEVERVEGVEGWLPVLGSRQKAGGRDAQTDIMSMETRGKLHPP